MSTESSRTDWTHDPVRRSWLDSANVEGAQFPIQNLPLGLYKLQGPARAGVALGDQIIDLGFLADEALLPPNLGMHIAAVNAKESLATLMDAPADHVVALRRGLSELFSKDNDPEGASRSLVPLVDAELQLPVKPTAFTDFCASIEHIRGMAKLHGGPPRLAHGCIPIAYNGRASSVTVSGQAVTRPVGLFEPHRGAGVVCFGAEPRLDFELELGAWLRRGPPLGERIPISLAERHIFGLCLVNDWSARAIQSLESVLGPHLGKSFHTSVSPWIITTEALAPFRVAARRREGDEMPVPDHLLDEDDRAAGAYAIELTAEISQAGGASVVVTRTHARDLYWTLAQMIAHQSSGGAPIETGDLIATGTVSGASTGSRACLAEINEGAAVPVRFADGSQRIWLEDGDTVTIRAFARAPGHVPIGFGECTATILPSQESY
ncbi:fumarylacetoacetate hydrolase family protein [Aurantiacibacter gilvus]|uniref:fumarylacetoacetase n=1 Tax=Aurantiacibacter gilvus TaxID=3139141 RepID=A0ABU9IFZ6_9SPHN